MTVQDLLNELVKQPGNRQVLVTASAYGDPAPETGMRPYAGSVSLLPSHVSYVNDLHVVLSCAGPRVIDLGTVVK